MELQKKQSDENKISLLYKSLLDGWNNHDATEYSNCFSIDGNIIGFDGSQMNGRTRIHAELSRIFDTHKVASFTGIIREIRVLSDKIFLLRAVAGMVPPGKSEINPETNAIQTLIAQKEKETFLIALFHNTPAVFHERPELKEQLTEELQQEFNKNINL